MISSKNHPQLQLLKQLHTAKGRKHHKQFLAEGIRVCTTLIESGAQLVTLYVTPQHRALAQRVCEPHQITLMSPEIAQLISFSTTASGVIGLFNIPETESPLPNAHALVLCNITDPGNMGTLIRTAAAMNIKHVIVIDGVDLWSPKVVQASAGTIAGSTIYTTHWETVVSHAKSHGIDLYALVVKDGKDPLLVQPQGTSMLVVGNEAHGIPADWVTDCTERITLRMPGNTESLNAAVAGSIALYMLYGSSK